MKHYAKLLKLGCFSRSDIFSMLGNEDTAGSMIRQYLKKGLIERVHRDLYAVISLETGDPVSSRYHIGCSLFPDAAISHHSAFEYYGYTNQVFYEVYVMTASRFSDFEYNGITYRRFAPKQGMDVLHINGLRITGLEQTVVDSIADLEKITGLEETLRCIALIPSLDENKLIRILQARANGYLWQKCGYILEEMNDDLHLSLGFFRLCREHAVGSRRPLLKSSPFPQTWNRSWKLYTPKTVHSFIDKGMVLTNEI